MLEINLLFLLSNWWLNEELIVVVDVVDVEVVSVLSHTTPAPSVGPQLWSVRWGQSCRCSSLPVHPTLSMEKFAATLPNCDLTVALPPRYPSCLQTTWASVWSQESSQTGPKNPSEFMVYTFPWFGPCPPLSCITSVWNNVSRKCSRKILVQMRKLWGS